LKGEALDRTMWRARFGWGFGPVVRQTTEWMSAAINCATLQQPVGYNGDNYIYYVRCWYI
jgi:hypothetical protein